MAETTGLVQKLTILPSIALACTWVGPSPSNAEIFFVLRDSNESPETGAFLNSVVDALASVLVTRKEVVIVHGANDARIDAIRIVSP